MVKSILIVSLLFNSILYGEYLRDDTTRIVKDTATNLMWQDDKEAATIYKNWHDAVTYCNQKSLGGFNDWRMPNIKELKTVIDPDLYNPAISSVFKNKMSGDYWSFTPLQGNSNAAELINFYGGSKISMDKTTPAYIRCVR